MIGIPVNEVLKNISDFLESLETIDNSLKLILDIFSSFPELDILILVFSDRGKLDNIECEILFLYATHPALEK